MKHLLSSLTVVAVLLSAQTALAQEPPWNCQYMTGTKALEAMRGSRTVSLSIVQIDDDGQVVPGHIRFQRNSNELNKAFIIQPGGNADPRAYAVRALAFAEQGYRVYNREVRIMFAHY